MTAPDPTPSAPEHNYEYGREHNGYSHMGIPPACPACAAESKASEPVPDTDPSATLAGIDQDPAVILEYIRDGAEAEITHPDDECGVKAGGSCTPHGALLAVAALEAVLALADEAVPQIYAQGKLLYWSLSPDDLRVATTTALTGTPQSGENEGP